MTGRAVKEWIGKHPDQKVPDRVRVRVFDRYDGICHISGRKIHPGEPWELEHIKPLHAGGEHRESNFAPALKEPHKAKTKQEMALKKKINKTRKKHIGATVDNAPKIASRNDLRREPKPRAIDKAAVDEAAKLPRRRLFG